MQKDLPRTSGIYLVWNQLDGKVWVGQSRDLYQRYKSHLSDLRYGRNSRYLQESWNEFGSKAFKFEPLMLCDTDELNFWENYFMSVFRSFDREFGFNIKKLADGPGATSEQTKKRLSEIFKGRVVSAETRKKISDRCKNPSEEVRKRISDGKKGKTLSLEHCQKLKEAQEKRFSSQEERDRLSRSLKGKPHRQHKKRSDVL